MKIIPFEKKEQVLAFFTQRPVPSFTEIAKQTGVNRVTIYHWYAKFEEGEISWCTRGKRSFKHYPSHIKKAVVNAYMEGNHNLESLGEPYGVNVQGKQYHPLDNLLRTSHFLEFTPGRICGTNSPIVCTLR